MRLLFLDHQNEPRLTANLQDDNIPKYAILSHVWGRDGDEVTFEELANSENSGIDKSKPGYCKIKACGEQAREDGMKFFWVDTCCIDKRSSAELSEAVNSMYRSYQSAEVCYAYLEDAEDVPPTEDWLSYFQRSVWLTRGWTLQELLAPPHVEFFDKNWHFIGNRRSFAEDLHKVTKIPLKLLLGFSEQPQNLAEYSIAQRMSWASARQTSRIEDTAYCLMGIFDINMPLLYGEGGKAFWRLQEEIIKISNDETILAWNNPPCLAKGTIQSALLASHPCDFARCGNIVQSPCPWYERRAPYTMTHRGLQIKARLEIPFIEEKWALLVLNCHELGDGRSLALQLWEVDGDYCRLGVAAFGACQNYRPDQTLFLSRVPRCFVL